MNKAFTVHMLNDIGKKKAFAIADAFDFLLDELLSICPAGRELSIVQIKLEEACFFAKKAMANDTANLGAEPVAAASTPIGGASPSAPQSPPPAPAAPSTEPTSESAGPSPTVDSFGREL